MKSACCRRSQRNSPFSAAERMPQTLTVTTRMAQSYGMQQHQLTFIDLALRRNALRFGRFTLKSGRESPYFFNAGLFSDGESALVLGQCYASAITRSGLAFDMIFGPAYKGIPLATAAAIALAEQHDRSVPYAFNRK